MQSAYDGFAGVSYYFDLYYNDRLHASSRGVPENILQWLETALGQTRVAALNAYIAALPGFPGLTLPSHGLAQGEKASAIQMANLFKVLPVALLAHDSVQAKFMAPIQGQHQPYVWYVEYTRSGFLSFAFIFLQGLVCKFQYTKVYHKFTLLQHYWTGCFCVIKRTTQTLLWHSWMQRVSSRYSNH